MALGDLLRRLIEIGRWLVRARRSLRPRVKTTFVLGQPMPAVSQPAVAGVEMVWVERPDDPHFEDVVRLGEKQGMDREWCLAEIGRGNAMLLAYVNGPAGARAAGVAWLNDGRHYVDDIYHDLDAGPAGCQLLNCMVLPEFRGRRLQRLLTRGRMARAAAQGKRWVYTVVNADNPPSLRNNAAEGNRPLVRVDVVSLLGTKVALVRRLTHRMPIGRLTSRTVSNMSLWVVARAR